MPHYLVTVASRVADSADAPQALYLLAGSALTPDAVAQLAAELLHDPVVQTAAWHALDQLEGHAKPVGGLFVEIAYKPGVTDNEAESVLEGARRIGVTGLSTVRTLRRYPINTPESANGLYNALIQSALVYRGSDTLALRLRWYEQLLIVPADVVPVVTRVALRDADDVELMRISREGILALDLDEMRTSRDYFRRVGRDPSDGELETIAQTWSEHCSHKTFKAKVRYRAAGPSKPPAQPELHPMLAMLEQGEAQIDSLIKTFLMQATQQVLAEKGEGWVLSAFVDNAGIIAFTDEYEVSFKVETHNHPSALEPFGGANTGVGGVIRDVLGVSAKPIANTDILCFGMPDMPAASLSSGVIHPARTCTGVVAGVRDYGNKLGIPTVNGAVLFDEGYTANPLVFCGTLGIAPRNRHPRNVQPGDAVVVLGGRTGRDGIHGATFSSVELTHTTAQDVGSAVQIGDPITEKKVLDVMIQARDRGLYSAVTDCGAGGLSSAVGEMGAETGAVVELERVPLKYAGLQPWEIWLSEAQERMVLAVPQANLAEFLALCEAEDVEAHAIGTYTDDHTLRVLHRGQTVVELGMEFLHDGRPQRVLEALWAALPPQPKPNPTGVQFASVLLKLLAHPNIASKERIIRTYDHEVGGATVIKPLVGAQSDGPGDAAVLQPLAHTTEGLALSCGVNPRYGKIDPYWMTLAAVDEAMRNLVAVGADPDRTAILDNFCWGDPRQPDRMAGLVRASAGCYDAALAFGTPFISGKDSLNNEYRDADGRRIAIPPTLLISALAHMPDVTRSTTMDLKAAENLLFIVGETRNELLGSHAAEFIGVGNSDLPRVDLDRARSTFRAMHAAIHSGLVQACHDISEGGLAVAAAEMAFAGDLGLELDLAGLPAGGANDAAVALFSESPSRFLVEVRPSDAAAFGAALAAIPHAQIGRVVAEPTLQINLGANNVISLSLSQLKGAWQGGLDGIEL